MAGAKAQVTSDIHTGARMGSERSADRANQTANPLQNIPSGAHRDGVVPTGSPGHNETSLRGARRLRLLFVTGLP